MTTQIIECPSSCTVTVEHQITTPLFDLSLSDGGQIAAAVVMVWTVGWAVRMAIRAMHVDETKSSSTDD